MNIKLSTATKPDCVRCGHPWRYHTVLLDRCPLSQNGRVLELSHPLASHHPTQTYVALSYATCPGCSHREWCAKHKRCADEFEETSMIDIPDHVRGLIYEALTEAPHEAKTWRHPDIVAEDLATNDADVERMLEDGVITHAQLSIVVVDWQREHNV